MRIPALLFCILFSLPGYSVYKIMIDPGHGGFDVGTINGKMKESDIALKVSQFLYDKLLSNKDFKPFLTRHSDTNLTLPERVKIAEKSQAQLFVSIHVNSNQNPRAKGTELYFQNHLPPDEDSIYLASVENQTYKQNDNENVSDVHAIVEDLHRQQRLLESYNLSKQIHQSWNSKHTNIRQAPFYVISNLRIPSVLIELGFLTNPIEAELLSQTNYQQSLAEKIYAGIVNYFSKNSFSVSEKN